jgi:hypothetical protein
MLSAPRCDDAFALDIAHCTAKSRSPCATLSSIITQSEAL